MPSKTETIQQRSKEIYEALKEFNEAVEKEFHDAREKNSGVDPQTLAEIEQVRDQLFALVKQLDDLKAELRAQKAPPASAPTLGRQSSYKQQMTFSTADPIITHKQQKEKESAYARSKNKSPKNTAGESMPSPRKNTSPKKK